MRNDMPRRHRTAVAVAATVVAATALFSTLVGDSRSSSSASLSRSEIGSVAHERVPARGARPHDLAFLPQAASDATGNIADADSRNQHTSHHNTAAVAGTTAVVLPMEAAAEPPGWQPDAANASPVVNAALPPSPTADVGPVVTAGHGLSEAERKPVVPDALMVLLPVPLSSNEVVSAKVVSEAGAAAAASGPGSTNAALVTRSEETSERADRPEPRAVDIVMLGAARSVSPAPSEAVQVQGADQHGSLDGAGAHVAAADPRGSTTGSIPDRGLLPGSDSPRVPDRGPGPAVGPDDHGRTVPPRLRTEEKGEQAPLVARAAALTAVGDVIGARLLLQHAADNGSAAAVFLLAQTYDPRMLARWQVRGIRGDEAKALQLYARARASGVIDE
jgi:hypothetical protein